MNIIVCCKAVPEEEELIELSDHSISAEKANWKVGEYDMVAIEAAKKLAAATNGKLTALSIGNSALNNTKLRKTILARGPVELKLVVSDESLSDSYMTAKALEKAIREIGDYDLVICGTGSSDVYAQQVGNQLGALLNVPVCNGISKLEPAENAVVADRVLENEIEVLEIPFPAVVSVTANITNPFIPSMKDIIAAGKKPVQEVDIDLNDIKASSEEIVDAAPKKKERRMEILEGESDENIDALVQLIKRELA